MLEIRGRLTEGAGRGWDRALTEHGTTATALLEAMGREFDERRWNIPERVWKLAREIDRERGSRS